MLNMMIAFANSEGPRWAAWIGGASLDAAALLALISLAWLVVRNRVAPQVGYCLFLLVPLKLLAPIAVTAPAAAAGWTPSAVVASRFADDPEVKEIESRQHVDVSIASSPAVAVEAIEPMLPPEPQAERPIATTCAPSILPVVETPRLSASAMVMVAWLVGVLLLSIRFVGRRYGFGIAFGGLSRSTSASARRLPRFARARRGSSDGPDRRERGRRRALGLGDRSADAHPTEGDRGLALGRATAMGLASRAGAYPTP